MQIKLDMYSVIPSILSEMFDCYDELRVLLQRRLIGAGVAIVFSQGLCAIDV
jgi:hypothetical protein